MLDNIHNMHLIERNNMQIRYDELLAKCERQRERIAMLEQSRADMRKHIAMLQEQIKALCNLAESDKIE